MASLEIEVIPSLFTIAFLLLIFLCVFVPSFLLLNKFAERDEYIKKRGEYIKEQWAYLKNENIKLKMRALNIELRKKKLAEREAMKK